MHFTSERLFSYNQANLSSMSTTRVTLVLVLLALVSLVRCQIDFTVENITTIITLRQGLACFFRVNEYITIKMDDTAPITKPFEFTRPISDFVIDNELVYKPTVIRNRIVNITQLSGNTELVQDDNKNSTAWRNEPDSAMISFWFKGTREDATYTFLLSYHTEGLLSSKDKTRNIIRWPYNDIYKWNKGIKYISTQFQFNLAHNNLIERFSHTEFQVDAPTSNLIAYSGDMKTFCSIVVTKQDPIINERYVVDVVYPSYYDDGTRPQGKGGSLCKVSHDAKIDFLFAVFIICWTTAYAGITIMFMLAIKNRKSICFCFFRSRPKTLVQLEMEQKPIGLNQDFDSDSD